MKLIQFVKKKSLEWKMKKIQVLLLWKRLLF